MAGKAFALKPHHHMMHLYQGKISWNIHIYILADSHNNTFKLETGMFMVTAIEYCWWFYALNHRIFLFFVCRVSHITCGQLFGRHLHASPLLVPVQTNFSLQVLDNQVVLSSLGSISPILRTAKEVAYLWK